MTESLIEKLKAIKEPCEYMHCPPGGNTHLATIQGFNNGVQQAIEIAQEHLAAEPLSGEISVQPVQKTAPALYAWLGYAESKSIDLTVREMVIGGDVAYEQLYTDGCYEAFVTGFERGKEYGSDTKRESSDAGEDLDGFITKMIGSIGLDSAQAQYLRDMVVCWESHKMSSKPVDVPAGATAFREATNPQDLEIGIGYEIGVKACAEKWGLKCNS